MSTIYDSQTALLLVDLQLDFLPGGALAVADGDAVIAVANAQIPRYQHVLATQDWHPANHQSFAANHEGKSVGEIVDLHGLQQILWPVHCVQDTRGAQFSPQLRWSAPAGRAGIFRKGTDPTVDSYSGFFDNGRRKATGLHEHLQQAGMKKLHIMGLATDYCVKLTALDSVSLGYETRLILPGCRGVELTAGDVDLAVAEMKNAGVQVMETV
jgi:nicotinamidase/pyrazinamidase